MVTMEEGGEQCLVSYLLVLGPTAVGKASSSSPGACPLFHCSRSGLRSVNQQHQQHLTACAAS